MSTETRCPYCLRHGEHDRTCPEVVGIGSPGALGLRKQDDEIAAWYRRKAAEQEQVRADMAEHRKTCAGGDCKECQQLEHRFDMSSMGD